MTSSAVRRLAILQVMLLAPAAGAAPKTRRPRASAETRAASYHLTDKGIVLHGEHLADFVLSGNVAPFSRFVGGLAAQIRQGTFRDVNEKFDGSPSVVLGFSPRGPFVAYKMDLAKKTGTQRLVHAPAEAPQLFKRSAPLAKVYQTLSDVSSAAMERMRGSELEDLVFQGDLLYTEGSDRKTELVDRILVKANQITYEVGRDDPDFARLKRARAGLVIHTVGRRVVDAEGRLSIEPLPAERRDLVERFVDRLASPDLFVIHPFRREVPLPAAAFDEVAAKRLLGRLAAVERLPAGFWDGWNATHLPRFRIFFNSFLRPPHQGGFYRAASRGEPFAYEKLMASYREWLVGRVASEREPPGYAEDFEAFARAHEPALRTLLSGYFDAVQLHYLLAPHLEPATRSKLGGGPVEGLMLRDGPYLAKWVDRLGFTLANNRAWNRTAPSAPFAEWKPGTAFVVMKGQPIHAGHVAMIRAAVERQRGQGDVHVILSDNAPNLAAETWKGLGAAGTKRELIARDYKYVFDAALRQKILTLALGPGVSVHVEKTSVFRNHVAGAKAQELPGKVKRVVGQKEIDEGRFADEFRALGSHLEPLVIDMQEGGLSGTQVRAAVKDLALHGSPSARALLERALGPVPEAERAGLIAEMVAQWRRVDHKAQALLGNQPE